MHHWSGVRLAALVLLGLALTAQALGREPGFRRRAPAPERLNVAAGYPGIATDPVSTQGRLPYWGQALGATYYNWGYFGARHDHPQYINHAGYSDQYLQFGATKGY